ncbi:hypothetical protein H8959_011231 [Pygathrix nigripes]
MANSQRGPLLRSPNYRDSLFKPLAQAQRSSSSSGSVQTPSSRCAAARPLRRLLPPALRSKPNSCCRRTPAHPVALGAHLADAQETPCLRRGSWRADRSPAPAGLRTGVTSCGAHTPHPAAAAAPELSTVRPSPSRVHNFGSLAALREAAGSAPQPRAGPGQNRSVWGKPESR